MDDELANRSTVVDQELLPQVGQAGLAYVGRQVQDVSLRRAAPFVTEAFNPRSSFFGFATDPCDATQLDNGPDPATRRANCAAAGIPSGRVDGERAGRRYPDGAARRGARHPQQAQRHRPEHRAPSRSVGAVEGRHRPASREHR